MKAAATGLNQLDAVYHSTLRTHYYRRQVACIQLICASVSKQDNFPTTSSLCAIETERSTFELAPMSFKSAVGEHFGFSLQYNDEGKKNIKYSLQALPRSAT
jgi:hypothetical protein